MSGPILSRGLNRMLRGVGIPLELSWATDPIWEEDQNFMGILGTVESHTLLDRRRLYVLYQLVCDALRTAGELGEAGVSRGGSALLILMVMKLRAKERTLHLFDSFQGLPVSGQMDGQRHKAGEFVSQETAVRQLLATVSDRWVIHSGWLRETTSAQHLEGVSWSFVHLDVDLYDSTMTGLDFFVPRLSQGGSILIDDFGDPTTPGVRKAVREYCALHPEEKLFYIPTGQAILQSTVGPAVERASGGTAARSPGPVSVPARH